MLDIKRIRKNPQEVEELLKRRNPDLSLDKVLELDKKRREILVKVEEMKARQNVESKQIPTLKKEGKDVTELMEDLRKLSEEIKVLDADVKVVDDEIEEALMSIPNTPNPDISI